MTATDPTSLLPHDLSPVAMFFAADWVVQTVLVILIFASVATWTVFVAKGIEVVRVTRLARQVLARIDAAPSFAEARKGALTGWPAAFLAAAATELRLSADTTTIGIKERIASRLDRQEAAAARYLARGTGVLATIGATAPFVGLFGTVWGIMDSFIGISKMQTTNLAVVAPGIAEALLATAAGLVAAIPAVVTYNVFARSLAGTRAVLADISAAIARIVSRDLDRHGHTHLSLAAE